MDDVTDLDVLSLSLDQLHDDLADALAFREGPTRRIIRRRR